MSTVILFSAARRRREAALAPERPAPLSGPKVVILPVVRIERHAAPDDGGSAARGAVPDWGRKVH
ncbi:hypothetical protein [Xanthobacter sp. KR7-225]|uniref:hypothetical protein n=1 Tax=Xanthobacter sp. KR7-225 TaxID=3156613 RepID=UPI0032B36B1E